MKRYIFNGLLLVSMSGCATSQCCRYLEIIRVPRGNRASALSKDATADAAERTNPQPQNSLSLAREERSPAPAAQ